MENNEIFDPDLKDVSTFLREQVELCHQMTRAVQDTFYRENNRAAQNSTLKMMTKLVGATATAAAAFNRLKGTQINQTITVLRARNDAGEKTGEGASPQNAKTNGPA